MLSPSVISAAITIGLFCGLLWWRRQKRDIRYREKLTTGGKRTPFGIGVLKGLCAFAFLFTLTDLTMRVLGIHAPLHAPRYGIGEGTAQWAFWAFGEAIGLLCGPLFYAIHRRLRVAWKLGWVVLIASYLSTLGGALESIGSMKKADDPGIAAATVTIGFSAVALYWLLWWNRQRGYFYRCDRREDPA